MFEDVGLQPPQHVGAQHVVELLDLVLLGDVRKLLQETLQIAAGGKQINNSRSIMDVGWADCSSTSTARVGINGFGGEGKKDSEKEKKERK